MSRMTKQQLQTKGELAEPSATTANDITNARKAVSRRDMKTSKRSIVILVWTALILCEKFLTPVFNYIFTRFTPTAITFNILHLPVRAFDAMNAFEVTLFSILALVAAVLSNPRSPILRAFYKRTFEAMIERSVQEKMAKWESDLAEALQLNNPNSGDSR